VCLAVVERGDLEMLQQLHARVERFPWSAALCTAAAHRGHLAVLQWLRAHGCAWDSGTADAAAANGRLATLQWALATDCPHDLDHLWLVAAEGGHVDVVEWLHRSTHAWKAGEYNWGAAAGGHVAVLDCSPQCRCVRLPRRRRLFDDDGIVAGALEREIVGAKCVRRVRLVAVARAAPKVHLGVDAEERRHECPLVDPVVP
jgi:hypothetical protein